MSRVDAHVCSRSPTLTCHPSHATTSNVLVSLLKLFYLVLKPGRCCEFSSEMLKKEYRALCKAISYQVVSSGSSSQGALISSLRSSNATVSGGCGKIPLPRPYLQQYRCYVVFLTIFSYSYAVILLHSVHEQRNRRSLAFPTPRKTRRAGLHASTNKKEGQNVTPRS